MNSDFTCGIASKSKDEPTEDGLNKIVEWTEKVIKHYLDIGDNKGDDYFDSMRKFFKDWYLAGNGVHPALALNLAIPHTIKPFKSYEGQAGDIIFDLPERYKVKK